MLALRRYAPFALLIAVQLVLVLIAPSRGGGSGGVALGGEFPGSAGSAAGAPSDGSGTGAAGAGVAPGADASAPAEAGAVPSTAAGSDPGAAGSSGSGTNGTSGTGAGSGTGGSRSGAAPSAGATAGAGGGSAPTGKAAQFCVTQLNEHPPCVPKYQGGDNGGATSMGVTAKSITVVMYRNKDNAAVDAILRTTGTYISPTAEKDMFEVVTSWINKHYQLYGRTIKPVYVQGKCEIAPPDAKCLRAEADSIAATYKPFAMFWDNATSEPFFFDQMSRKGVVNWGGWHFADSFNNGLRPFHYDVFTGGTVQAELAGTWWCKRLAGKKAKYAGSADLKALTRKVAVVYPDADTTGPAAQRLMSIINGCAPGTAVDGKYSSDTSTASSQATTQTAQFKSNGVTSILYFSDPIAPAYGTKAQAAQNYQPEQVLAGSGLLDYDALAQTYDQSEWSRAFGLSDLGQSVNVSKTDAAIIWKAEGRSGSPDANSNLLTAYLTSVASGVVAAGPKLTPLSYEYGLLTSPGYDDWATYHDPTLVYVKYGKGDYTALSDVREVVYSPTRTSPVNGHPGTYVALSGGRRYQLDELPGGELALPAR